MATKLVSRSATTFSANGAVDEEALSAHLTRFAEAGIGVLLASTGSGEGGSLTLEEAGRVYRIGVDTCKGKVLVSSNQHECFTARQSIEHARLAIDCGIERLNIYGPDGLHGYRPTAREYRGYFDAVLDAIDAPVSLCPNPILGYTPDAAVIAGIANDYPQVSAVLLSGHGTDDYLLRLLEGLERSVEIYVNLGPAYSGLMLGATGVGSPHMNFIPKTFRQFVDRYDAGEYSQAAQSYRELRRFGRFVEAWPAAGGARWIKMAMAAFELPGWEGGLRAPYAMPDQDEIVAFREGMLQLGIREIEEAWDAAQR